MTEYEAKQLIRDYLCNARDDELIVSVPTVLNKKQRWIDEIMSTVPVAKDRLPKVDSPMRVIGTFKSKPICIVYGLAKNFKKPEYLDKWWEMATLLEKQIGAVVMVS